MTEYQYNQDPLLEGIPEETFQQSVVFTYMTRGNDIYHEFVTYLLRQARLFPKFSCALVQNSWRPATEELFQLGLQSRCDFIHIMDTDIGLRHDTTARLIAADKDIVASPLYFYDPASNDIHLNVHYKKNLMREYTPRMPDGGVEEIFATAFGSVVIKHRVLEAFAQANEPFCEWTDFIDEEYKGCSPDTIFFLKARELGFRIWMDWRIPIGTHHKYARFNSTLAEKFYVQRWFDVTFGPEAKNELFETEDGRNTLKTALQSHYASGLAGRGTGSGDPADGPEAEGAAAAADDTPVREGAGELHGAVGATASAPPDAGGDA